MSAAREAGEDGDQTPDCQKPDIRPEVRGGARALEWVTSEAGGSSSYYRTHNIWVRSIFGSAAGTAALAALVSSSVPENGSRGAACP